MKSKTKWLDFVGHMMSVGDIAVDLASNITLHKQSKTNLKMTVGTHIFLTLVAAGISIIQTERIMQCVRKEAMEGPDK